MTSRKMAAVAAVTVLVAISGCTPQLRTVTGCLVHDKDRTGTENSNYDMRVYSSCGTFKVADTWDRHNSADVFGAIKPGETYTIRYIGERNPSWSQFPNLIDAEREDVA